MAIFRDGRGGVDRVEDDGANLEVLLMVPVKIGPPINILLFVCMSRFRAHSAYVYLVVIEIDPLETLQAHIHTLLSANPYLPHSHTLTLRAR